MVATPARQIAAVDTRAAEFAAAHLDGGRGPAYSADETIRIAITRR